MIMDPLKNRPDMPATGLEAILPAEERATLPRSQYQPRGEPLPKRLDALWHTDSLERRMREFIRPRISDQEMLSPLAYENRLRRCLETLNAAGKSPPPEIMALQQALDQELKLRELLSTYRNLLLQA